MKILYTAALLVPLLWAVSCQNENPPLADISGTEWIGTNIAKGELVCVTIGEDGTMEASLSLYRDPESYDIRGGAIDTTGHLVRTLTGTYEWIYADIYGNDVTGYRWNLILSDASTPYTTANLHYDNLRMHCVFDGGHYPMRRSR